MAAVVRAWRLAALWDLQRQLATRQDGNAQLRARNQALAAEIASLRQGSEAIEERARGELHMMRPEETFFQLQRASVARPADGTVASGQAVQLGLE